MSELALAAAKNGGGSAPMPPSLSKAKSTNPREARQARMAQSFSQVVAVLMRDNNFRNLKIGDLEWLVIPPIMAGQFKLGHAAKPADERSRDGGVSIPVAVVLWARVSAEIDKRFSEELEKPMQLRPDQWASGDNVWIMATAGDRRALPHFMKELAQTAFKGQTVKMRTRTSEGKVSVKALSAE